MAQDAEEHTTWGLHACRVVASCQPRLLVPSTQILPTGLTQLNLDDNSFAHLPLALAEATALQSLSVNSLLATDADVDWLLEAFPRLHTVRVSSSSYYTCPDAMTRLREALDESELNA